MSGITFLDNSKLSDDTILNMRALTNNTNKIQETVNKIANDLKIEENAITFKTRNSGNKWNIQVNEEGKPVSAELIKLEENRNMELRYNTRLVNYLGINEENAEEKFSETIIKISIPVICVVILISFIMLYSSFKMTYSERIREYAMLSSLRYG